MPASFSCLVPFYNESDNVVRVLKDIIKVKKFNQIIAIDDGSNDDASKQIEAQLPQIQLIKLKKNYGKAAAVAAGLKKVKTDYVMLFDSDIKNIKSREVRRALSKIESPDIDLVILKKVDPNPDYLITSKLTVYSRISCVFSGERVLKTSDLKEILSHKLDGYQLEAAINQYMMKHGKVARWVKSSIKHPYVYTEGGVKLLANKYSAMALQIIQGVGVANFVEQLATFCNKEA